MSSYTEHTELDVHDVTFSAACSHFDYWTAIWHPHFPQKKGQENLVSDIASPSVYFCRCRTNHWNQLVLKLPSKTPLQTRWQTYKLQKQNNSGCAPLITPPESWLRLIFRVPRWAPVGNDRYKADSPYWLAPPIHHP